jgi:hypothetical protein
MSDNRFTYDPEARAVKNSRGVNVATNVDPEDAEQIILAQDVLYTLRALLEAVRRGRYDAVRYGPEIRAADDALRKAGLLYEPWLHEN